MSDRSNVAPRNLVDVLRRAAATTTAGFVHHQPAGLPHRTMTAQELLDAAVGGGAGLRRSVDDLPRGGSPRHVPLVLADPLQLVQAFFMVLCAGMVPVPAPGVPHLHQRHRQRLARLVGATEPAAVVTDCPDDTVRRLAGGAPVLSPPELAEAGTGAPAASAPAVHTGGDTAYVQYTSGSINDPKPVRLRHANVLAQLRQAADAFAETPQTVSVNWVPLHHDMGIVTSVLRPLWSGYWSVVIDPFDFVRDPALWLRAMTTWGATHTSAPDFGYALCARKSAQTAELDLSRLSVARSAGEPVRATTIDDFCRAFQPSGFRRSAFNPSYGLAEATLTVTASPVSDSPTVLVASSSMLRVGRVVPATGDEASVRMVSSGRALTGTTVKILDPDTAAVLPDGVVGEVWISGPQVSPLADGALRIGEDDGYRTGDMGVLVGSDLYLMGRGKERFQVAGENYYCGDVEAVATAADARLRAGRGVCVMARRHELDAPVPTLLLECREAAEVDEVAGAAIARAVVAAVGREVGLAVRRLGITPKGSTPLTTSGKVQREACRVLFETGHLPVIYWYERGER